MPHGSYSQTFVAQTGGLQGGWDDYDHGAFLRIRNRHKVYNSSLLGNQLLFEIRSVFSGTP